MMISPLKISVAMATYNGSLYLPEQLGSLIAQDLLPDELVVTDDGSTDGTLGIIEEFAATAPFEVRVYRNDRNVGPVRNFERAIARCSGDIVFLSDQDDVWLPPKIKEIVALFGKEPSAFVALNDKLITRDDLTPTGATMLGNIRNFGSPDSCFVAGCCAAFRRAWLSFALPIPEGVSAHDTWLVGLAHRLQVVALEERPLQLYRRHGNNVSHHSYSEARSVGLADRLRSELISASTMSSDASDAYWDYFIASHRAELSRIEERRQELALLGLGPKADKALCDLRGIVEATEQRKRFARLGVSRRIVAVWRMWRSGYYRHFSGWKSAVKDAVSAR